MKKQETIYVIKKENRIVGVCKEPSVNIAIRELEDRLIKDYKLINTDYEFYRKEIIYLKKCIEEFETEENITEDFKVEFLFKEQNNYIEFDYNILKETDCNILKETFYFESVPKDGIIILDNSTTYKKRLLIEKKK